MLSCDGFSDISFVSSTFLYFGCIAQVLSIVVACLVINDNWLQFQFSWNFAILTHPPPVFILMDPEIPSSKMFDSARRNIMAPIQAMRIMVGIQWENCWLIRKAEISRRQADTKCPLSTQATLKSSQWNTKSATDDEFFTNNPIFGGKSQRFSASDQ